MKSILNEGQSWRQGHILLIVQCEKRNNNQRKINKFDLIRTTGLTQTKYRNDSQLISARKALILST